MKQLMHLLWWDLVHLQRNRMIAISLLVAAAYLGIFYLLKALGNLEELLIVMIFNDPVIMSYFFAGALLLFEKDQRTLNALLVTPFSSGAYLWAKGLALSLIATGTALLMTWVGYGWTFHYGHFVAGVLGSALLFAGLGCLVGLRTRGFNAFLVRSIGVFIPAALPLLLLFEVTDSLLLYVLPSTPGILLLKAAFASLAAWQYAYCYGYLLLALALVYYWCQKLLVAS